jgi:hypothetical protein
MTVSTRNTSDYETLRAAALSAEPPRGAGFGVVRRHGLASWLKVPQSEQIIQPSRAHQVRSPGAGIDPAPATSELAHLIAGIVMSLAAEPANG